MEYIINYVTQGRFMTPIRGKNINFRLRQVSQDRFELLHACRRDAGLNYNKSDIMSEAIDVLFEKEKNLINAHKKNELDGK